MRVVKSLVIAALLIGSLLLGVLVASVTACSSIRQTASDGTVIRTVSLQGDERIGPVSPQAGLSTRGGPQVRW